MTFLDGLSLGKHDSRNNGGKHHPISREFCNRFDGPRGLTCTARIGATASCSSILERTINVDLRGSVLEVDDLDLAGICRCCAITNDTIVVGGVAIVITSTLRILLTKTCHRDGRIGAIMSIVVVVWVREWVGISAVKVGASKEA